MFVKNSKKQKRNLPQQLKKTLPHPKLLKNLRPKIKRKQVIQKHHSKRNQMVHLKEKNKIKREIL